jgi:hypothetical protein
MCTTQVFLVDSLSISIKIINVINDLFFLFSPPLLQHLTCGSGMFQQVFILRVFAVGIHAHGIAASEPASHHGFEQGQLGLFLYI